MLVLENRSLPESQAVSSLQMMQCQLRHLDDQPSKLCMLTTYITDRHSSIHAYSPVIVIKYFFLPTNSDHELVDKVDAAQ